MFQLLLAASISMPSLMTNQALLAEVRKMKPVQVQAMLDAASECAFMLTDEAARDCLVAVRRALILTSELPEASATLGKLWKWSVVASPAASKRLSMAKANEATDAQMDAQKVIEDTLKEYYAQAM